MQNLQSITIPKPCHESWQAMNPVTEGRHCQSCCKTVTDFTVMSNDEIITYLSANHNVCGRFNTGQITNVNDRLQIGQMHPMPKLKGWALILAMLGPVTFYKAIAQNKPAIVQSGSDSKPVRETSAIIGKIVAQYKIITGVVTDEGNLPLTGVTISVPNSSLSASTNTNGKFSITVPASVTEIDVHYIGFITGKVTLDANVSQQNYTIKLKEASTLMGDVVVVKKPSFVKRVYSRCVRRPYRTLKKKLASL